MPRVTRPFCSFIFGSTIRFVCLVSLSYNCLPSLWFMAIVVEAYSLKTDNRIHSIRCSCKKGSRCISTILQYRLTRLRETSRETLQQEDTFLWRKKTCSFSMCYLSNWVVKEWKEGVKSFFLCKKTAKRRRLGIRCLTESNQTLEYRGNGRGKIDYFSLPCRVDPPVNIELKILCVILVTTTTLVNSRNASYTLHWTSSEWNELFIDSLVVLEGYTTPLNHSFCLNNVDGNLSVDHYFFGLLKSVVVFMEETALT